MAAARQSRAPRFGSASKSRSDGRHEPRPRFRGTCDTVGCVSRNATAVDKFKTRIVRPRREIRFLKATVTVAAAYSKRRRQDVQPIPEHLAKQPGGASAKTAQERKRHSSPVCRPG